MPRYEFLFEKCKKAFELAMTISEHGKAKVKCPTAHVDAPDPETAVA